MWLAMRDEIGRSQGASVADVVDPTSRRRNEAEKLSGQFRRIPMGRHAFSARMRWLVRWVHIRLGGN